MEEDILNLGRIPLHYKHLSEWTKIGDRLIGQVVSPSYKKAAHVQNNRLICDQTTVVVREPNSRQVTHFSLNDDSHKVAVVLADTAKPGDFLLLWCSNLVYKEDGTIQARWVDARLFTKEIWEQNGLTYERVEEALNKSLVPVNPADVE